MATRATSIKLTLCSCRENWNVWPFIYIKFSCCYQECILQYNIRRVFKSWSIKMQDLVELWALLGLFLSKIFDQVGGAEWSTDVGLFIFEGYWDSKTDALSRPPPPPLLHPPFPRCLLPRSLILKLSLLKLWVLPLAVAGFVWWRRSGYAAPHRYKRSTISVFENPSLTAATSPPWTLSKIIYSFIRVRESLSVGFRTVEGFNPHATLPPDENSAKILNSQDLEYFRTGAVR